MSKKEKNNKVESEETRVENQVESQVESQESKVESLEARVAELEEHKAELEDKNLRMMAEFDNFRKRTEKEKSSMYSSGAGDVITKFLPVLDNFERGLADVKDDTEDAFQKGMLAIYKQFKTAIDDLGVKEIDALGKTFDPNFHNAVMHVDDADKGEQEIVEVLQKGYTYNDKVIRYAMVKVAN